MNKISTSYFRKLFLFFCNASNNRRSSTTSLILNLQFAGFFFLFFKPEITISQTSCAVNGITITVFGTGDSSMYIKPQANNLSTPPYFTNFSQPGSAFSGYGACSGGTGHLITPSAVR